MKKLFWGAIIVILVAAGGWISVKWSGEKESRAPALSQSSRTPEAPAPSQPLGQSPRTQKRQRREGRLGTVGAPEARGEAPAPEAPALGTEPKDPEAPEARRGALSRQEPEAPAPEAPEALSRKLREAMFYRKIEENQVWCQLCPRKCIIPSGARGVCGSRENRDGKLYPINYGKPCSIGLEPIEKAPLYHFKPGHKRFVVAAVGCNLRCKFCQNWNISQTTFEQVRHYNLPPEEVVSLALKNKAYSICFTFSEPISFYDYMHDIAKLAKKKGLKTSMVSNGYINPEPLKQLLKVLDAVKIDLKAFTDDFYQKMCSAELEPVLKSLKLIKKEGTWLEIVNLVIPTLNDDPGEIKRMCEWIKKELGPDVPLHFTRFHPAYKLTKIHPTPIKTLEKAYKIAKKAGLNYVFVGNVPGHAHNNTACPKCGKIVIRRAGFQVLANSIKDGKCKFCGHKIEGLWE